MEGRRIPVTEDFSVTRDLERPGDYAVYYNDEQEITQLWMNLPRVGFSRICTATAGEVGPRWEITEDSDGRVTVKPSIQTVEPRADGEGRSFHGFLTAGVWSEC